MNIAHNLERAVRYFPDKPAILFEGGETSYRQLEEAVNRTARGLAALGVEIGDRVALLLPNIPAFAIAYLAIQKLGAVAVSVSAMLTTAELDYVLADSGAKAIFTAETLWPALEPLVEERLPRDRVVICEGEVPGVTTVEALGASQKPEFKAREMERDTPAAILYTSGTTGRQKGAVLSHGNIISNLFTVNRYLRMSPADRVLVTTPLFHVAAQNVGMNAGLNAAATLVLQRRFDVERCAVAIEEHKVTFMSGVPTIYIALLNARVRPEALSSVRLFQSAAATMPVEIARRWQETYGKTVYEGYGLTETSPAATYNHEYEYRHGSVGTAVDMVEMRLFDAEDRDVPPGSWGEVVFKGPNVMLGYWNRPAETAEALRSGWFHTGDIGYLDEAGYLYLVDRVKDMINSAGFKIWPREVEEVLYQHPAIRECAVAGVPDPVKGEIAKAYIVLRDGGTLTEQELDAYCRGRLAAYKVPRAVAFLDQLPKSPAGKILKRVLREQEAGRMPG
ncbi:MAG TPA: long-chain fatty acid--CoA ligase [Methylomirabilota bacterium]|nr:long-chain fatty acid--CoA ligase [Methylomirabilota bacterium]